MLPKQWNSNAEERIHLMDKYQYLFGLNTVDYLVADREFIGSEWLDYLTFNKITDCIRMRDNFDGVMPKNGKNVKATLLFGWLKLGNINITVSQEYASIKLLAISRQVS